MLPLKHLVEKLWRFSRIGRLFGPCEKTRSQRMFVATSTTNTGLRLVVDIFSQIHPNAIIINCLDSDEEETLKRIGQAKEKRRDVLLYNIHPFRSPKEVAILLGFQYRQIIIGGETNKLSGNKRCVALVNPTQEEARIRAIIIAFLAEVA